MALPTEPSRAAMQAAGTMGPNVHVYLPIPHPVLVVLARPPVDSTEAEMTPTSAPVLVAGPDTAETRIAAAAEEAGAGRGMNRACTTTTPTILMGDAAAIFRAKI